MDLAFEVDAEDVPYEVRFAILLTNARLRRKMKLINILMMFGLHLLLALSARPSPAQALPSPPSPVALLLWRVVLETF